MNILLALDSAMGIFNNVPPRIHYVELDLQMPCHPEFFELSSYAEMLCHAVGAEIEFVIALVHNNTVRI